MLIYLSWNHSALSWMVLGQDQAQEKYSKRWNKDLKQQPCFHSGQHSSSTSLGCAGSLCCIWVAAGLLTLPIHTGYATSFSSANSWTSLCTGLWQSASPSLKFTFIIKFRGLEAVRDLCRFCTETDVSSSSFLSFWLILMGFTVHLHSPTPIPCSLPDFSPITELRDPDLQHLLNEPPPLLKF